MGRFYAMDRDKRWERLKIGYDALTLGIGTPAEDFHEAIKASYATVKTVNFENAFYRNDIGARALKAWNQN